MALSPDRSTAMKCRLCHEKWIIKKYGRLDKLWEDYISSRIEGLALEAWEGQLQSWKTEIKE
jgi:hypothetical protein